MSTTKLTAILIGAVMATTLPFARAEALTATPEVKTALAKAAEGPDSLRRYIQRTRMIYALNYADVMALALHQTHAAAALPDRLANAGPESNR